MLRERGRVPRKASATMARPRARFKAAACHMARSDSPTGRAIPRVMPELAGRATTIQSSRTPPPLLASATSRALIASRVGTSSFAAA